jgi:hypothetical protein
MYATKSHTRCHQGSTSKHTSLLILPGHKSLTVFSGSGEGLIKPLNFFRTNGRPFLLSRLGCCLLLHGNFSRRSVSIYLRIYEPCVRSSRPAICSLLLPRPSLSPGAVVVPHSSLSHLVMRPLALFFALVLVRIFYRFCREPISAHSPFCLGRCFCARRETCYSRWLSQYHGRI